MAVTLTVNGTAYSYPQLNDTNWGENATNWATAVTSVLNGLSVTGDIGLTTASLANNQVAAADVTSLSFNSSTIRSATIEYSIYRLTGSFELSEAGILIITYTSTAATWEITRVSTAGSDSGVTLSITTLGQVQYISTNVAGTGYSGQMKYRARVTK